MCKLVVVLLAAAAGCEKKKHTTPAIYEIPADRTGWITIRYDVPSAAPLPVVDGKRIYKIPTTGLLETSSPKEDGILHQEFYAIGADGKRTALPDASRDPEVGPKVAERTFDVPIVCCMHWSDVTDGAGARTYELFYIGRGPAGEPPDPPPR